jgi:hypothetical protein
MRGVMRLKFSEACMIDNTITIPRDLAERVLAHLNGTRDMGQPGEDWKSPEICGDIAALETLLNQKGYCRIVCVDDSGSGGAGGTASPPLILGESAWNPTSETPEPYVDVIGWDAERGSTSWFWSASMARWCLTGDERAPGDGPALPPSLWRRFPEPSCP